MRKAILIVLMVLTLVLSASGAAPCPCWLFWAARAKVRTPESQEFS